MILSSELLLLADLTSFSLSCFPFLVVFSIPVRLIEFVAKFIRNEKWYKIPIALVVVVPLVLALTVYHSFRMLAVSFKQTTVLKLDRFGQAKKLDVEHGFKFDRKKGWDAPVLSDSDQDPTIASRRLRMFTHGVCIYLIFDKM
jgi:hypothetical protein